MSGMHGPFPPHPHPTSARSIFPTLRMPSPFICIKLGSVPVLVVAAANALLFPQGLLTPTLLKAQILSHA